MAVDEAPRLTRGVVLLLTCLVFLLCYFADSMKCRPGGRRFFCLGPRYKNPCYYSTAAVAVCEPEHRLSFWFPWVNDRKDETKVIFYTVEVSPSDTSDRQHSPLDGSAAGSFAEVFTATLADRADSLLGLSPCNWTGGKRCPSSVFQGMDPFFLFDVVTFPYKNLTKTALSNRIVSRFRSVQRTSFQWLHDLFDHLPTERDVLKGGRTLQKYFPSLHMQVEKLFNEARIAGRLQSLAVNFIIFVVINPGVYLENTCSLVDERDNDDAAEAHIMAEDDWVSTQWVQSQSGGTTYSAAAHIVGQLDSLLTFKPQIASISGKRVFVPVQIGFPAHTFTHLYNTSSDVNWDNELVKRFRNATSANKKTKEMIYLSALTPRMRQKAMKKRPAWMNTMCKAHEQRAACEATCDAYIRQSPYVAAIEPSQAKMTSRVNMGGPCNRAGPLSCVNGLPLSSTKHPLSYAAYQNCYYYLAAASTNATGGAASASSEPNAPSPYFSDCLHLTREGMKKLAECVATSLLAEFPT